MTKAPEDPQKIESATGDLQAPIFINDHQLPPTFDEAYQMDPGELERRQAAFAKALGWEVVQNTKNPLYEKPPA